MTDSFELLTGGITSVYKSIQKIKKLSMSEIGLKGVHAMCIYYLYTTPDGLTAAGRSSGRQKIPGKSCTY